MSPDGDRGRRRDSAPACPDCLRRSWLIARLAPCIELVVTGEPRSGARELLALPDEQLCRAVAGGEGARMLDEVAAVPEGTLRAALAGAGLWAVCRHAPAYPPALSDLRGQAPALLAGRGDPALLSGLEVSATVTVVGSRRASAYGKEVAHRLGLELAAAGLCVVSGMANGIDSHAHRGALDGGGRTVAVLGGGAEVASPIGQARLYERIAASGLILSELPPGTRPHRWTFPARNRIMAALAAVTVVVEAAERSGSLITATMATDLSRDVGAVPGPVNSWRSAGCNSLLADGAAVIRGAEDVLDLMLGPGRVAVERRGPPLDAELGAALDLVERGHTSCDAIARASGGPAADAVVALTRLELLGYLSADASGRYSRTGLKAPGKPGDAHSG